MLIKIYLGKKVDFTVPMSEFSPIVILICRYDSLVLITDDYATHLCFLQQKLKRKLQKSLVTQKVLLLLVSVSKLNGLS